MTLEHHEAETIERGASSQPEHDQAGEHAAAHDALMQALEGAKATDPFPGEDGRPCWRVYDSWTEREGRKHAPGVYWHGIRHNKDGAVSGLPDEWACGPLYVEAITTNAEDGEHGRLLRFTSATGQSKRWAMPMSMLAADGNEVRGVLMDDGLLVNTERQRLVTSYIASQHPTKRLRAATVTGWHGNAFVLPHEVIGADDIWFQAAGRTAPYGAAGTLEEWKAEVAAKAIGNPALMLAICAALAGPLLESLNIDGGGIHLYGDSSTGKTTALKAAASVWGGPKYRRTWRATSNGLEGAAKLHSGTLLALDEVGEVAPKELYESIYALCNGSGKSRANVHGNARDISRWRVFLLSTGEVTIASRMAAGGFEAKAGQTVRVLDIPVAALHGAHNDLHGHASGAALSDAITDASAQHYGHAGRAFVAALVEDARDGLDVPQALAAIQGRFGITEGQEGRAARLLAVCALAGEFAIEAKVLPWPENSAIEAAVSAFKLWREGRPASGQNAEHGTILRSISDFIGRHGDSRFSDIDDERAPPVRERAGYRRKGPPPMYLFLPVGLREATKGYDLNRVLAALNQAGALAEKDTGKNSKKVRPPGMPSTSMYHVDPERLGEDGK